MSVTKSRIGSTLQSKKRAAYISTQICALILLSFSVAGCGTPITRALWIANGPNVVEYLPSQLTGTGAMVPHLMNNSNSFGSPQGVVFDIAGDLWVMDGGTLGVGGGMAKPALYGFTPAQLAALHTTPNPVPAVTINSGSFTFPQQAIFDAKGNLWVSDFGSDAVFVFTPAQLAVSGTNVKPFITLRATPGFNGPLGITFDAAGDLFVANNNSTTIFEFNAAALPATSMTVMLAPNVILSDNGQGSVQAPWALAFDSMGNLYHSNANPPNSIVAFSKASLAATGSPAPMLTLSPAMAANNTTLNGPNGIAFDNRGGLAVLSSNAPFGLALYGSGQLKMSGATVPGSFIVGAATTLNAPAGANFGPVVN